MHRLFKLLRNVMNYHNLRECRLQVGHVMSYVHHLLSSNTLMHYTMHVLTQKQCILCSVLHHKSYLTLPYLTSLRDSLRLGTFARLYYAAALQPCLQEAACWQLDGPMSLFLFFFFFFLERVGQMNKGYYSTVQNRSLYCLAMSWGWR